MDNDPDFDGAVGGNLQLEADENGIENVNLNDEVNHMAVGFEQMNMDPDPPLEYNLIPEERAAANAEIYLRWRRGMPVIVPPEVALNEGHPGAQAGNPNIIAFVQDLVMAPLRPRRQPQNRQRGRKPKREDERFS